MTSVVSPYSGPVIKGKPGIRLVLSSYGFFKSPLPALCGQATSCAWRARRRRILNRTHAFTTTIVFAVSARTKPIPRQVTVLIAFRELQDLERRKAAPSLA